MKMMIGLTLALAWASANGAALPPLFGDGEHDDTAAIQARLDTGASMVYLPPPAKHYLISKALEIGSGQELKLDRFTLVRLAPMSDCHMVINRNWKTGDRRVAVTGGVWDLDNTRQSPNPHQGKRCNPPRKIDLPKTFRRDFFRGEIFCFDKVEDLAIRGVTMMNPTTYSIQLTRTSSFIVDDVTFDFRTWNPIRLNMDGVHLDGGCHHGRISNLRGTCFDDLVAVNANDGICAAYEGDITDIDIDGVYADYCHSAVRLLSTGANVRRITIRNVHGNFYTYAVGFTHYFADRPRGNFDDIVVENVFVAKVLSPEELGARSRADFPLIQFQGPIDCGTILLRNVSRDERNLPVETIGVDPKATIRHLTVRDSKMVNRLDEPIRFIVGAERVGKLTLENNEFVSAPGAWETASVALSDSPGGSVAKHVFSMSCKVTACNRELNTPEGKRRCVDWCRTNGITKLWLESYRHAERVPTELLVAEREYFRSEGFEVSGMITPTQFNDAPDGEKPPMVVCWSDPVARRRLREEVVRVAPLFGTVIVDDFLFSLCGETCPRCRVDKARRGIADWGAYRRELMHEVARDEIVNPARQANPAGRFIVKFPCWWHDWEKNGYSPKREACLFGSCWVGTETRDACQEPFRACWIVGHLQKLTDGRCEGGWYDALDCTPEKFVEQAYYTILSGAKESFIHCYDYLLAADPGVTPFGEKADRSHACARLFEKKSAELRKLADFVSSCEVGPSHMQTNGVSIHLFRKGAKTYRARLNTKNEPVDGLAPHGFELLQQNEEKR